VSDRRTVRHAGRTYVVVAGAVFRIERGERVLETDWTAALPVKLRIRDDREPEPPRAV
jgi:hypothetical protein